MKFALVVRASPLSSAGSRSALRFARAVLTSGHTLTRVFFHGDGTLNASALTVVPQDEEDLTAAWAELGRQHGLDLVICVASALKRGVLDQNEARRYERACANMRPEFTLSGLGQLIDAALDVDRLVTFGGRS